MAKLYLVPTPIGNLDDITIRALRVLEEADVIAAEDTSHSAILLHHYDIKVKMLSLHQHNEHAKVQQLLENVLQNDLNLAVITDAGTPGISDPGFLIVREALKLGIAVEALPGATAFVPALVLSGLPMDSFVFEGFLPVKKGRKTHFEKLVSEERTLIFYESPYRFLQTIDDFITYFGEERRIAVARELTKVHEEVFRGTLAECKQHFFYAPVKGEFVLVLAGKS